MKIQKIVFPFFFYNFRYFLVNKLVACVKLITVYTLEDRLVYTPDALIHKKEELQGDLFIQRAILG